MLVVNAFALLSVLLRSDRGGGLTQDIVEMAAQVEFPLLSALVVCFLFAPAIQRLQYRRATFAVTVISLFCVFLCLPLLERFELRPNPLRWSAWTIVAALLTMAYFHWRASAATPAIAEARVLALNARIRPHFFFNSINGVLGVIRSDPKRAEHALEALADLFRALMQENRKLVPLGDEIDLCERYLELERLRLGERLTVDWELRHCPMDTYVPPLMLQPLIENAVYHGIEPSSEPGRIEIRIVRRGRELHIRITNPVCAEGRQSHGNRMAQANIRERLALFFDIEASMENGQRDGRYVVQIRLPIKRESTQ
jgi:two-component system sensor histidine kinase AlgZ